MSEIYEIIADESKLDEFIDWLPDTNENSQYYITLFARKKYIPDHPALRADKTMIKRITSQKKDIKNKLRQMECRVGAYTGANNIPIPQNSLAVYISPSPRDLIAASFDTIQKLSSMLRHYMHDSSKSINPRSEVMNAIQLSGSRKKRLVFDLDSKDEKHLKYIEELYSNGKYSLIETRGGYHIIIDPDNNDGTWDKLWYNNKIRDICDVVGDALTPIVGCYQGGFIPKLIKK